MVTAQKYALNEAPQSPWACVRRGRGMLCRSAAALEAALDQMVGPSLVALQLVTLIDS